MPKSCNFCGLQPVVFPLNKGGQGVVYYRLKQTDYNEDFTYSKIVAVNLEASASSFAIDQIYPTNAHTQVNISYQTATEQPMVLDLFDAKGSRVNTYKHTPQLGANKTIIDVSDSTPGLCFILLKSNGKTVRAHFIKH